MTIDLRKEQLNTLKTPRLNYSFAARIFFFGMDLATGNKNRLAKAKLLEILACIPYREWEIRQYFRLTYKYFNRKKVDWAQDIIAWGRAAQDNEYMHLIVIQEKMREDNMKDPWFLSTPVVFLITTFYIVLSKIVAWTNIKAGFRFNAEFEDHAEIIYAQMVQENPQWEKEPVTNPVVKEYADLDNYADIFRRIGLDERDHRNHSLYYAGMPEKIFNYDGMPDPNHH